jgi:hypothetical protein
MLGVSYAGRALRFGPGLNHAAGGGVVSCNYAAMLQCLAWFKCTALCAFRRWPIVQRADLIVEAGADGAHIRSLLGCGPPRQRGAAVCCCGGIVAGRGALRPAAGQRGYWAMVGRLFARVYVLSICRSVDLDR